MDEEQVNAAVYQCYPLHPVSTYILPRLSERVAQNERTLFTFLSAEGSSTLRAFLSGFDDTSFQTVSPDLIYDYFEPLFRKEAYEGTIHKTYLLTEAILGQLPNDSLEGKLVKTISLVYILEVPLNADTLMQINAQPSGFSLVYVNWDIDKEQYVSTLATIFSEYVVEAERNLSPYDYVANAMRRWYMDLPRFTKEAKRDLQNESLKKYNPLMRCLKAAASSYQLLFDELPSAFGYAAFTRNVEENIRSAKHVYDELLVNLRAHLIESTKKLFSLPTDDKSVIARKSLSSCVKDWCETLDSGAFTQLFPDGTERFLELFTTASNDDDSLVLRLAKLATGLRIEDWDNSYIKTFTDVLYARKNTAEQFHSQPQKEDLSSNSNGSESDTYQLTFVDDRGTATTKRFKRVDISPRARLLTNQITSALSSMGQSISEQEKRQVLMDIIKKLC